jgi:hypothetical protein
MSRRCIAAYLLCVSCSLWGCGSGGVAAAPMSQGASGMDAAGQAAPVAGATPISPPSAAGAAAAGGGAPHVCAIPNEIMILDSDANGSLDPSCQNVPRKVIANNCIGGFCHDSNGPPAGGIDLMAPCVAERLVNVKSDCEGLLLLDVEHPEQSFLIDKLNSQRPTCGKSMPDSGHLPADELACMNAWIKAVIRTAKQLQK